MDNPNKYNVAVKKIRKDIKVIVLTAERNKLNIL